MLPSPTCDSSVLARVLLRASVRAYAQCIGLNFATSRLLTSRIISAVCPPDPSTTSIRALRLLPFRTSHLCTDGRTRTIRATSRRANPIDRAARVVSIEAVVATIYAYRAGTDLPSSSLLRRNRRVQSGPDEGDRDDDDCNDRSMMRQERVRTAAPPSLEDPIHEGKYARVSTREKGHLRE